LPLGNVFPSFLKHNLSSTVRVRVTRALIASRRIGSKEGYSAHQRGCPTCIYYTPGWNRARRVPGPDRLAYIREEFSKQFDEDDVEFLIESENQVWAMHDTATYIVVFRAVVVGVAAMLAFGVLEHWPVRELRRMPRWVLQLLGIVVIVPFAAWVAYWLTTGGHPRLAERKTPSQPPLPR